MTQAAQNHVKLTFEVAELAGRGLLQHPIQFLGKRPPQGRNRLLSGLVSRLRGSSFAARLRDADGAMRFYRNFDAFAPVASALHLAFGSANGHLNMAMKYSPLKEVKITRVVSHDPPLRN